MKSPNPPSRSRNRLISVHVIKGAIKENPKWIASQNKIGTLPVTEPGVLTGDGESNEP